MKRLPRLALFLLSLWPLHASAGADRALRQKDLVLELASDLLEGVEANGTRLYRPDGPGQSLPIEGNKIALPRLDLWAMVVLQRSSAP